MGETESHIASIRVADRWMCHHKVWKPDPTLILTKKKIMELKKKNVFESPRVPFAPQVRLCWPPCAAAYNFPDCGGDHSPNTSGEEEWRLPASLEVLSLDPELQLGIVWSEALS